jgi:sulfate adenylyltransferase subunit 2
MGMEKIELPSLYFSHSRRVFTRDGVLLAESAFIPMKPNEVVEEQTVRFRTIGDITSTGASLSEASTIDEIINEVAATRITERGGRADDKRSETSMEDRKKEGYF